MVGKCVGRRHVDDSDMDLFTSYTRKALEYSLLDRHTRSRFQLNVTAGSQKRAIANLRKSEGKNESLFA